MAITGVGQDAAVTENERGGKHSLLGYRFDLLDARSMFEVTRVLHDGAAKYGEENWRQLSTRDHLNHALVHIFAYLAGDTQDDHLSHAFCRTMMAQAVELQGGGE